MRTRGTTPGLALALAGSLCGGAAHGVGGTIFDNDGMVYVTYDATHWSDGFPGFDFSLPTPPDGVRRDVARYSGWWVRPDGGSRELRLGNPVSEVYDPPNGLASFAWGCPADSLCVVAERGRVLDARAETGGGTFVSELVVRNGAAVAGAIDVFHFLDPLTYGQPEGHEVATHIRPNLVEITTSPVQRTVRYRASGFAISRCSADDYASAANLLVQLNDDAPTTFLPGTGNVASPLGVNCAMRWRVELQPGEERVLRVGVSVGVDARLVKGDFNLDNTADLYFADPATGATRLWPMKGSARFDVPQDLPPTPGFRVVGVDDFNQDFSSDLLLRRTAPPYELYARMGDGVGFRAPVALGVPARGGEWEVAATGDFGYDGHGDILWRNTLTQRLEISRLEGIHQVAVSTPSPDRAVDGNWQVVAASDFDRDSDVDLVWYNVSSGKIVFWWLNASFQRVLGAFADPPNAGDANWAVVAGADFGRGPLAQLPTAYGIPDLLWRNATSSRLVVWHMNGAGRRTAGLFASPDSEAPNWVVAGPR